MFNRDDFYKEVGLRLQLVRRRKDLTQQEVADAVGVPRATYANVERGRQTIALDLIWRLSVFFGHPIDQLCPEPVAETAVSSDRTLFDPREFAIATPIYVGTYKKDDV